MQESTLLLRSLLMQCFPEQATPVSVVSADLRALWQFKNLIKCTISGSDPLHDYNNYGCCWGCCKIHDDCYSAAMNNPDCFPIFDNPYTEIYSYTCEGTTVTCTNNDLCSSRSAYNPEYKALDISKYCK
ncbi:phospholipase A2-like [Polyodon spathula]|uniref:phospholipase A2-like n=1 Tax=Polyodon spathula TaxID=7913 RepID=UPI001B7DC004|nr:phospholipase A2-like [Polyodon spathula]